MSYDQDWYAHEDKTSSTISSFEIIPDSDAIVLRGSRDEATDQLLTGRVVLNLKAPCDFKLRLRFSRRVRHTDRINHAGDPFGAPVTVDLMFNERELWEDLLWGDKKTGRARKPAGEHVFPFQVPVPANIASSLEGPGNTYVVYRLKCVVERGAMRKDYTQKQHIRIHRTRRADDLSLQQAMLTDSHWPDKCAYKIQTPTKGIIYGTSVPMDYRIAPLKKGIRPAHVRATIIQQVRFKRPPTSTVPSGVKDTEREIVDCLQLVPADFEQDLESWYNIKQKVQLPKDLAKCCQSYKEASVQEIEVRHFVKYKVGIANPDGHISEIQGKLPITIFFTQSMHVDDTSLAVSGLPEQSVDPMMDALNDVPPDYNHCHLDALYNSVGVSGYTTPLPQSGALTPRNASVVGSMDMLEEADENDADDHEAHANALRNRLDNMINPISAAASPPDEPNAAALRNRLEQINLRGRNGASGLMSGSGRSGTHSPVSIARNRSFHGSLGQSPLASMSMTPSTEHDDPMEQTQAGRSLPSTYGSSLSVDPPSYPLASGASGSPGDSGSVTPGGARSAMPTRPSSPVHFENLNRVPSYRTAVATPAPMGPVGSQHGGDGLPTYMEAEEESASRSGSITGSGGGSGPGTPATAASIGDGAAGPSSASARPGGLTEHNRSLSGMLSGLLHKNK